MGQVRGPCTAQRSEGREFSGSKEFSRPGKGHMWLFLIFGLNATEIQKQLRQKMWGHVPSSTRITFKKPGAQTPASGRNGVELCSQDGRRGSSEGTYDPRQRGRASPVRHWAEGAGRRQTQRPRFLNHSHETKGRQSVARKSGQ